MVLRDLGKKVKKQFSEFLEIPGDVAMDLPKITLVGSVQLLIENHRGIIEYTREGIRVSVVEGEVAIAGENLMLRNILPDELYVEGEIHSIKFL
ncbi:MAG: sporulation protein YqfC [Desulfotomaculaceae bacterium]|nr:sporulation protein YqfC [Desulfotomaculaceae bacterium]